MAVPWVTPRPVWWPDDSTPGFMAQIQTCFLPRCGDVEKLHSPQPPCTSNLGCTRAERGASGSHISQKGPLKQGRGFTFLHYVCVFLYNSNALRFFFSQKFNRKKQFSFKSSSQWFFWATPQKNSKHICPPPFFSPKKDEPPSATQDSKCSQVICIL